MLAALRNPATLILIAINLTPIAGVLWWGWDAFVLLMLYWLETAVIAFWTVVRIAATPKAALNDLHIQQNSRNIFVPLMNGTVTDIRRQFEIPLGAGGVTYPPNGMPIASKYLINEYARLGIDFSFLRRTFIKDHANHSMEHMVHHIRKAYDEARRRSREEVFADFQAFREQVERWTTNPHHA